MNSRDFYVHNYIYIYIYLKGSSSRDTLTQKATLPLNSEQVKDEKKKVELIPIESVVSSYSSKSESESEGEEKGKEEEEESIKEPIEYKKLETKSMATEVKNTIEREIDECQSNLSNTYY